MHVAYSKPWVTRALVCPSCPSISFSGGHSLPHPQKPTKCLQSGLGLPHLPHLPETFFHSLLAGQPHDHFGYPQYSFFFPLQLAPLNEYYFENIPDEAYLCRTAGYSGPASAARPLLLGVELDVAAPSWTRQTPFFLSTISALF